jgi:hypothetical protein
VICALSAASAVLLQKPVHCPANLATLVIAQSDSGSENVIVAHCCRLPKHEYLATDTLRYPRPWDHGFYGPPKGHDGSPRAVARSADARGLPSWPEGGP